MREGDNKESGRKGYTDRATIKRASAEVILIKGPQREEKSDNNESGRMGYTVEGPA